MLNYITESINEYKQLTHKTNNQLEGTAMNELFVLSAYLLLFATALILANVVNSVMSLRRFVKADESVFEAVDKALDSHVKKIARLEYELSRLVNDRDGKSNPNEDLFTEEEIKSSSSDDSRRAAYEKYMDSHDWRNEGGTFNTEDIVVVEMPTKTPKKPKHTGADYIDEAGGKRHKKSKK